MELQLIKHASKRKKRQSEQIVELYSLYSMIDIHQMDATGSDRERTPNVTIESKADQRTMADASYESLLDFCVSAAMASVRNMNYDQVGALLEENGNKKIDEIINNISQVQTLPTEREMGLVQNKSLAEWNLSQEPKIEEAKRKLQSTYEETVKVKEEVMKLKEKLDSLSEQRSLDTSSALLQAAAQSADDESEAIADRYLNGEIEVDQFLKDFIEKKTLAHMRKIKSEKLLAILRQQQYYPQPSSSTHATPYPVQSTGLYPNPAPSRHSFWS